jgi:organic radical activating enzyme
MWEENRLQLSKSDFIKIFVSARSLRKLLRHHCLQHKPRLQLQDEIFMRGWDSLYIRLLYCLRCISTRWFREAGERGDRAERSFIIRDAIPSLVPDFISQVILSGMSTNPCARPIFNEIIEELKRYRFRITAEADSEAVSVS